MPYNSVGMGGVVRKIFGWVVIRWKNRNNKTSRFDIIIIIIISSII